MPVEQDPEQEWRVVDRETAGRPHGVDGLEVRGTPTLAVRLRQTSLPGVRILTLQASPHEARWTGPGGEGAVGLSVVLAGRKRFGAGVVADPGSLTVSIVRPGYGYTVLSPVRTVTLMLLPLLAPPHLTRLPVPLVIPAAERTPIVEALVAVLEPLGRGPLEPDGGALPFGQGLADLALAVLSELAPERVGAGPDAVRFQAHEVIEHALGDAALDAAGVARAVGVAPRALHAIFREEGTTVARAIRERRLDVAARVLRDDAPVAVAALAEQVGFAGPDQFTRAFRARFGTPPFAYRDRERASA